MPAVGSKYARKVRNSGIHQMTVVEVDGGIGYRVGKNVFKTPSAAAKSVNGGHQVNGWLFWKIDE